MLAQTPQRVLEPKFEPKYSFVMPKIPGKKTSDCFSDQGIFNRSRTIDTLLPDYQTDQPDRTILPQNLLIESTFRVAAEAYLGVKGDCKMLEQEIIARHCTVGLQAIETLAASQLCLDTNQPLITGGSNFFFVNGRRNNSVFMLSLLWFPRVEISNGAKGEVKDTVCKLEKAKPWKVDLTNFDHDFVWKGKTRFFFAV